ncbi:M64 family metallopeptidase [Thalassotalea nanhaiensis]|uniref:M64 family metallopeptidase n=1 Tax=Thalassotalea nanhaiensis TaxID=3065648 RepID=A0ABY9TMQ6_9GAMM|nr:M64 family metallopeptidase [Colwelliaceae bacterium SQ345]
MNKLVAIFGLFLSWATIAQVQTLRVDYYHTGDSQQEIFSLDSVVVEPLAWPGSKSQVLDDLNRGKYRFIIKDKTSKQVLFTRSYSSIYGEWETTGEAKKIKRTFHESLRFPMPDKEVIIEIEKRDAKHQFQNVWTTEIDPNHYLNHRESAGYAEQVIAIEHNGDPKNKVDLLILGDGYTKAELSKFKTTAKELTEALFATSPFKENRKNFNVWALAPLTKESGVSRPSTGTYHDSPLGVTYDAFGSERYVLTSDNRNFRRIASSAPYDFVEIIVNNDTYGGGGIYGLYSTAAANSDWADYLFIHEFGHHFAGLADEYYTSSVAYAAPTNIIEPYEPNVTALLNGDTLKWQTKVNKQTPLPTPWPKQEYEKHSYEYQQIRGQLRKDNKPESEMDKLFHENQRIVEGMFSKAEYNNVIGAFEGANYSAKGFYRSELNCIMFTRTDDFCDVCQQGIVDVIKLYSSQ